MRKKKKIPRKSKPRQKVRVFEGGAKLIGEFFIDPKKPRIDIDIYVSVDPQVTANLNYPESRLED